MNNQRRRNIEAVIERAREISRRDGVPPEKFEAFVAGMREAAGIAAPANDSDGRVELGDWFMRFARECALARGSQGAPN